MEWLILLFVLVAARGSSAAATSPQQRPASILPVQQGRESIIGVEFHVPLNPNLNPSNQIAPNVFAPDQTRDTVSREIHAIVGDGPTIAQQQAALLMNEASGFGNGADQGGQPVMHAGAEHFE